MSKQQPHNGQSKKKIKQGELKIWNFQRVSKKQHVEFPGVNEKRTGISKRDQEKVALLHFRTPLLLLMIHHEETRLNANRNPNSNLQAVRRYNSAEKITQNFKRSWFLVVEFPRGDPTKICGISRGGALFCREFPGVK